MFYNLKKRENTTPKRKKLYCVPYGKGIIDERLKAAAHTNEFYNNKLSCIAGYNGEYPLYINLKDDPHILTAGLTKSGKSTFINTLLLSLLLKNNPEQLELYIIDPKLVDWIKYKDIPHTKYYCVNEFQIITCLRAAVNEMNKRNAALQKERKKNIYNSKNQFSDILILFDEIATFSNNKEITSLLNDLARMGRSAGIHLILSTQNPTVKVINSQIKYNLSTKVCFRVSSGVASRTILDCTGGEKLKGNGNGLIMKGNGDLFEIQSIMVSEKQEDYILYIWQLQKNGGFYENSETHRFFLNL